MTRAHLAQVRGAPTRIYFENSGKYITAAYDEGVLIRCNSDYTDIGDHEPLDNFVDRNGGPEGTAEYLHDCYRRMS